MNRIRQLRKEKDWSQEQLGEKLKVGKSAVSKYELGQVPLTDAVINKLCVIFNVSADYLLGISNIRRAPLTQEQGDLIIRNALKDTGLLAPDGNLSEKGKQVISEFLASNAEMLKKLIQDK
jgi:transcriptional regulator with XRE-family HTH domain